jgi:hypothetical protein
MRNCRGVQPQVAMRLATIAAAFVLFCAPLAVEAQQPGKVYRVGVLTNKASDPVEARLGKPSGQVCGSAAGSRARTS